MVKLMGSHTRIKVREKHLQQLKVPVKIYHQYKLASGKAVDCFQLDFHPTDSSSLIPTCFKHRIHSITLQNFTKVSFYSM